jgi:hypothetical protein
MSERGLPPFGRLDMNCPMVTVKQLQGEEWLVTVDAKTRTEHQVRVTEADVRRLGKEHSVEELLKASFEFLLEREPNTSILSSFDLPVIGRYFPEYEKELKRILTK